MHEAGAKEPRDGEDPLGMSDDGDDLVLEKGRELCGALGSAGWTEPAPFTREGEQVLGGAIWTADAGEASLEDAAVEAPRDHAVEAAARAAPAAGQAFLRVDPRRLVPRLRDVLLVGAAVGEGEPRSRSCRRGSGSGKPMRTPVLWNTQRLICVQVSHASFAWREKR